MLADRGNKHDNPLTRHRCHELNRNKLRFFEWIWVGHSNVTFFNTISNIVEITKYG